MSWQSRYQQGVTLTEVLVTVAIIGIIAAIAIPSYQDQLDRERLDGAVQAIYNQAIFARRQSISNNNVRYLHVQEDSGSWCSFVSVSSVSGSLPNCDSATIFQHGRDYGGVTISDPVLPIEIGFSMPNLTATPEEIELQSPNGNIKKVKISGAQLITVE